MVSLSKVKFLVYCEMCVNEEFEPSRSMAHFTFYYSVWPVLTENSDDVSNACRRLLCCSVRREQLARLLQGSNWAAQRPASHGWNINCLLSHTCKKLGVGSLVVTFSLELYMSYSSSCHHSPPPSSLAPIEPKLEVFRYRLTQVHLENEREVPILSRVVTYSLVGWPLVARMVKIPGPLYKSVGLFQFCSSPCISSQAVILTKFRFTSCIPMDKTISFSG